MRILFDQGTPAPLRHALADHVVETAYERGWSGLKNGELIAAAEAAGFEIFITTDKNLRYQQHLVGRSMAVVVLQSTSWPRMQRSLSHVVAAINTATNGSYAEVDIP